MTIRRNTNKDHNFFIIRNLRQLRNSITDNVYHWESMPGAVEADAINRGLNYATGEIFNWINPDDYLESYSLFRCGEAFQKNNLASGWVGAARKIDPNDNVTRIIFPNGLEKENLVQDWNGEQFGQPSCFLSSQKVKNNGGIYSDFSTFYGLDLWLRLLDRGDFIVSNSIWSSAAASTFSKSETLEPSFPELSGLKAQYGISLSKNGDKRREHERCQLGYTKAIKNNIPDCVWIIELWSIAYVEFVVEHTKALKAQFPKMKIILDTVDFHFKEFYRKYEQTKDQTDLGVANHYLKNEKILYKTADVVVVVSEDEKRDIQSKIMKVKQLEFIPNIHEIPKSFRNYSKRRNICFLGNFGAMHNYDAVQFFLDNIFHLVIEANQAVEFHVLGHLSEKRRRDFSRPNVKVIGSLRYLHRALTHYKLFVCPLTYGTGMKGKIGDAITAGIPIRMFYSRHTRGICV